MAKTRDAALEALNEELNSLTYSISHDLRGPLRAIGGFSDAIVEDYSDRLDDEGRQYLSLIQTNVRRMGRLIDDVLLLSRLSRKELDPVEIGMEELARSVFAEAVAEEPGREVRLDLDPLPMQWGDCPLLREAWSRLLTNAVKFTRPRQVAVVHVGCRAGEKENVYFVEDNGVGFDPRYAHRLFELFQRLHSDDEFEGSGAGLAIVHRIISRHGGRVWAEGEPDKGATFYFALKPATSAK